MKLALVQMIVVQENPKNNLQKIISYIKRASKMGAKIILFPEAALTDYVSETHKFAQDVPNGPACRAVWKLAERLKVYVSFGLIEKHGIHVYITQVFLGPNKFNYKYRKTWLYSTTDSIKSKRRHRNEPDYFDPGNGPEIFNIAGLKSTCMICADSAAPRCLQIIKKLKPQIVFFPNNVELWKSEEHFANIARKCDAPLLIANRVGTSWGEKCEGGSAVFSKSGKLLAEANKKNKEEIVLFDLKRLGL